jgi:hypothetical protein
MTEKKADDLYKLERALHEALHGIFVYSNGDITNWEIRQVAQRLKEKVKLRE